MTSLVTCKFYFVTCPTIVNFKGFHFSLEAIVILHYM